MHQAVGQLVGQATHHGLGILTLGQALQRLGLGLVTQPLPLGTHVADHLAGPAHPAFLVPVGHAVLDQRLGLVRRHLAVTPVFLDDLMQVIDGIKEDVAEFADLRLDVPRYGDIDHEHRAVAATLERSLDHALAEDRQGRRGG